jgi:hypothetical protein
VLGGIDEVTRGLLNDAGIFSSKAIALGLTDIRVIHSFCFKQAEAATFPYLYHSFSLCIMRCTQMNSYSVSHQRPDIR